MSTTTKDNNNQKKLRPVDDPYEIWQINDWEWRVLKKYGDEDSVNARWFVAVKSPFTYGSWEYGDEYVNEIKQQAFKVYDEEDLKNE